MSEKKPNWREKAQKQERKLPEHKEGIAKKLFERALRRVSQPIQSSKGKKET